MSSTAVPCVTAHPALLLIEPASLEYSERAAQLERSEYCVTQVVNAKDIFLMRHAFQFSVAVLNDGIGYLALRASTQLVRAQWPYARVLILGHAPHDLEDFLYDEAVVHTLDEDALCLTVHKLVEDQWKHPEHGGAKLPNEGRLTPRQIASWIVQESDPTKMPRAVGGTSTARTWPSSAERPNGLRR